jgi:hypothetical protein
MFRIKFEPIDKELHYFYPKNCYQALRNIGSGAEIKQSRTRGKIKSTLSDAIKNLVAFSIVPVPNFVYAVYFSILNLTELLSKQI